MEDSVFLVLFIIACIILLTALSYIAYHPCVDDFQACMDYVGGRYSIEETDSINRSIESCKILFDQAR